MNAPAGPDGAPGAGNETVVVVPGRAEDAIAAIVKAYEDAGVEISSISMSKPTLDDVFLKYTATRIGEVEMFRQAKSTRRSFKKHAR